MRYTQPYIPITGRLAKQILGLRYGGLSNSDFTSQIVGKYSGFKLLKFQFAALIFKTAISNANSNGNIINTIQILQQDIFASTTQLNLNLLLFWNTAIKTLLRKESVKSQTFLPQVLTFLNTSTNQIAESQNISNKQNSLSVSNVTVDALKLINRTSQIEWRQQVSIGNQQKWLNPPMLIFPLKSSREVNLQNYPSSEVAPASQQSEKIPHNLAVPNFIEAESTSQLPTLSRILNLYKNTSFLINQTLLSIYLSTSKLELQQQWLNQTLSLLQSQPEVKAIPLSFQHQQINTILYFTGTENNNNDKNNILQPDSQQTEVNANTSILTHSQKASQTISTVERSFNLTQRLQSIETQSIVQHQKAANNITDGQVAPHHIRTKGLKPQLDFNILPGSKVTIQKEVDNNTVINQKQRGVYLANSVMEFAQPNAQSVVTPNEEVINSSKIQSTSSKNVTAIKANQPDFSTPNMDMNRLVDKVFELLERKFKIERQRRGKI